MLLNDLLTTAQDLVLAAPSPTPTGPAGDGGDSIVNIDGIYNFFATIVGPILLAVVGIVMIARANRGNVSQNLTSSGIAVLGLVFVGGAFALFALGDNIVNLIIGG